jgi:hypothetical protein
VLIRPLPFSRPGELVMLEEKRPPRLNHFEASPLKFLSWKAQAHAFRDLVMMLGYDLRQRRFGGDPGVIGRSIQANGMSSYTVVGVMPPGFRLPDAEELWKRLAFAQKDLASRSNHFVWVVGRLKPGVEVDAAQTEMDVISPRLAKQFPQSNAPGARTSFRTRHVTSLASARRCSYCAHR